MPGCSRQSRSVVSHLYGTSSNPLGIVSNSSRHRATILHPRPKILLSANDNHNRDASPTHPSINQKRSSLPDRQATEHNKHAAGARSYAVFQMTHMSPCPGVWMRGPSPTSAATTATIKRDYSPTRSRSSSKPMRWNQTVSFGVPRDKHMGFRRSDREGERRPTTEYKCARRLLVLS